MSSWDKNIELRSEEVREIIGKTPSWVIRWGTLSFALALIILIIGAIWFRYPDRIQSELTIMSGQPPIYITARTDGQLKDILVEDKQVVSNNQILAVIESADDYNAVLQLKQVADSVHLWMESSDTVALLGFVRDEELMIGSLKNELAGLVSKIANYLDYQRIGKFERKITALKREIFDSNQHYQRLFSQKQIKEEELALAQKSYLRQADLFEAGAISEVQFEDDKQVLNTFRYEFGETRAALSAQNIQISRLKQTLADYTISMQEDESTYKALIEEKLTLLQGAIREWELKYLLRSPISGRVSFTRFWSANQVVHNGESVMTVIQDSTSLITGRLLLPAAGAGKVAKGQKVLVRFEEYPYMEFGVVKGIINSISLVSDQSFYSVEVDFPAGLKSTYNLDIHPTQGMV
ncbi:MAG: HlyD family efflux transporter periplasmic adaptor subunit, partial [Bacteroidales bacterium]|nr:HlyD family efflux transporter periplasmic adaptor subunit [Bacteroidales bacterium]